MKRNFQSILLILFISSGLFAQGNVLQINSPTTGELVSTSFLPIDFFQLSKLPSKIFSFVFLIIQLRAQGSQLYLG